MHTINLKTNEIVSAITKRAEKAYTDAVQKEREREKVDSAQ